MANPTIKHKFVSAVADGADATQVRPTNWNDAHSMRATSGTLIGNPTGATAEVQEITLGSGLTFTGTTLAVIDPGSTTTTIANGGTGQTTAAAGANALLAGLSTTQGAILYRDATTWQALAPGTAGQVLQSGGASANPSWITGGGGGGMVYPPAGIPLSVSGSAWGTSYTTTGSGTVIALATGPTLNSPSLLGGPTSTSPAVDNSSTRIITSAWYFGQVATATPSMSGTAAIGTSGRWSRDDHVHPTDTTRAPLAGPTFTGTVTLPSGAVLGTPASLTLTNATGLSLTAGVTGILPVASGGSGTATPGLVAGTNVTVTGAWPNQTVNATGGGGGISYPTGTGIPQVSGGAAWGTTLTTSGTGTVAALAADPALTGTPTAPTASAGTNTTQIATTAFALANGPGFPAAQTSVTDNLGASGLGVVVGTAGVIGAGTTLYLLEYLGGGTWTTASLRITTATAGLTSLQIGIYSVGSGGLPNSLLMSWTQASPTTAITYSPTTSSTTIAPGWYWVAILPLGVGTPPFRSKTAFTGPGGVAFGNTTCLGTALYVGSQTTLNSTATAPTTNLASGTVPMVAFK